MKKEGKPKPVEEATTGGTFSIPDGSFVYNVDLDCDEPYAIIVDEKTFQESKVNIPKSLAYYLSFHFCGSARMEKLLLKRGEEDLQQKIKDALKKAQKILLGIDLLE